MTTSAAHITVPAKETTLFKDLQTLVKAAGPNKHDQAIVLCNACIESRIDMIGGIMEIGIRSGLNRGHIARILKDGTGHRWRRDGEGIYTLL